MPERGPSRRRRRPADDYDDYGEDYDDYGGGYDDDASSRRRGPRRGKSSRKKQKSADVPAWLLPVVIGACVFVALGAVGFVVWDSWDSDPPNSELADTELPEFLIHTASSAAAYTFESELVVNESSKRMEVSWDIDYRLNRSPTELVLDITRLGVGVAPPSGQRTDMMIVPGGVTVSLGRGPAREVSRDNVPQLWTTADQLAHSVARVPVNGSGEHASPQLGDGVASDPLLGGRIDALCLLMHVPYATNVDQWQVARSLPLSNGDEFVAWCDGTLTYSKVASSPDAETEQVAVSGTLDWSGDIQEVNGVEVRRVEYEFSGTQTFSRELSRWVSADLTAAMTMTIRDGWRSPTVGARQSFRVRQHAGGATGSSRGSPVRVAGSFLERRAAWQTQLKTRGPSPQDYETETPPEGIREVMYDSGDLALKAWYAVPDDADGRRPAIVFFHGGFAFGGGDFDVMRPFRDAGFAVMTPMLRGENGNPGDFELFGGEFNDACNAVRWLARQPDVDPDRVYAIGHSAGGGLTALLALAEPELPLKHCASMGGLYPPDVFQGWADICPFDPNDATERSMRLLLGNQRDIQRRHMAYVGTNDNYNEVAPLARDEDGANSLLQVVQMPGDHFTSVETSVRAYLNLINAESSPSTPIPTVAANDATTPSGVNEIPPAPKFDVYHKAPHRLGSIVNTAVGGLKRLVLAPLPRQSFAVCGANAAFQIRDVRNGNVQASGRHEEGIESVGFGGDGRTFLYGTSDRLIRFYEISSKRHTTKFDVSDGVVVQLAAPAEGRTYAAGTSTGAVLIGQLPGRTGGSAPSQVTKCAGRITHLNFFGDDKLAAASEDGRIRIINPETRAVTRTISLNGGAISAMAITQSGAEAVVATERLGVLVINMGTGSVTNRLYASDTDPATALAIDATTGNCAIGTRGSAVMITKGLMPEFESRSYHPGGRREITDVMFSHDGKALAAAGKESEGVAIWNLTQAPGERSSPSGVFSPLFGQ